MMKEDAVKCNSKCALVLCEEFLYQIHVNVTYASDVTGLVVRNHVPKSSVE
jgi:hypothetical protein